MAGVDHLVVYMQTAVKYNTFYIHHSGEAPLGWGIYKLLYFTTVCIYTTTLSTPAIALFFLGPNLLVVYIFGVRTLNHQGTWLPPGLWKMC